MEYLYIDGTLYKAQTDHMSFKKMLTCIDPNGSIMRRRLRLGEFDEEVPFYCPGLVHLVPGAIP